MAIITVKSRPVWGAWIEIGQWCYVLHDKESRPVWGAWIEIAYLAYSASVRVPVAPRMGRVD